MAERWPYNLDGLVLGALAGLAGTLVKFALELLALAFIPSYKSCVRLAAAILFVPAAAMSRFDAFLLGLEIDLLVGSVAGVVAVEILARWGRDHLLLKGAGGGALAWLICYGTLCKYLSKIDLTGTSFLEIQISLAVHIVFGITVAAAAVWIERQWGRKGEKGP
ncbi:MAG: hypothetical protein K6T30_07870 [Alicyclobacillus sp.]|nr:hypothetical protein [Alicyclobacillus sp.]